MSRHSVAKWPVSNMSTRSPGESVFTSAASHAPVPDDGKTTTGALVRGAPLLGEHTREILAEHGYAAHEIETLVASGAVLDGAPGAHATPRGSLP